MAFSHGKDTKVYANGRRFHDYLNSIETPITADTAETTVFNSSGVKTYVAGSKDATLSAEGLFEGTTATAFDSYLKQTLGGSSSVVWTWYPSGDSLGSAGYGTKTWQTAYNIQSPIDGVVGISVEGQSAIGARDRVLSLTALRSATTTGPTAASSTGWIDNSTQSTKGGIGYFQRVDGSTAPGGTRSITPVIQHSSAGTSWATLLSFAANSAKGAERVALSTGTTVKRYVRLQWTLGATTKPVWFQAGFYRKQA